MTIKEFLVTKELVSMKERLLRLKQISAPKIMIESLKEKISNFSNDNFNVGGNNELLEVEYETHVVKTGRGGKKYLLINDAIQYFPNARYGRFISA